MRTFTKLALALSIAAGLAAVAPTTAHADGRPGDAPVVTSPSPDSKPGNRDTWSGHRHDDAPASAPATR